MSLTPAQKQAEYRKRQKAEEQLELDRRAYVEWRKHQESLAEKEARDEAARKNKRLRQNPRSPHGHFVETPEQIEERVERALRYNRWRWQLYTDGEIDSPPIEIGAGYKPLETKTKISELARSTSV